MLWTFAGPCGGGLLFIGWVLWVNGGIGDLTQRAGLRMVTTSWLEWAALQAGHLVVLFGALGAAVLLGGAWLLRARSELWLPAGAVLAVTLAYAAVFRGGSGHPYWNAGLIALVALGGALSWERVQRSSLPLAPGLALVCVLPFLGAASPTTPGRAEDHVAAVSAAASRQPRLYGTMLLGEWATYESGRPATTVATCSRVRDLAGRTADAAVITTREWVHAKSGPPAWSQLSAGALAQFGDVALVTAAELADDVC